MPDIWNTPRVWTAGEKVTASKKNDESENFRVLFPFTAAGQVAYSSAADQLAALAKPSVDGIFRMLSTGVPNYVPYSQIKGSLHDIDMVDFAPGGQVFSSTWADITGATLTLTLEVTCTIAVLAVVTGYQNTVGRVFFVRAMVNGVGDAGTLPYNGGQARNEGLPYIYRATGVTAGSRVVKMQCQADTDANRVERGRLIAAAFVE